MKIVIILWWLAPQVEGAELDEHALPRRGQERVEALPRVVPGVEQLRRGERAVAGAAAAHERAVALCNTNYILKQVDRVWFHQNRLVGWILVDSFSLAL